MFFRKEIRTGIPTYTELVKYAQQQQTQNDHNFSNENIEEDIQAKNTNTDTLGLDAEQTNTIYDITYTYSIMFSVINLYCYIVITVYIYMCYRNEENISKNTTENTVEELMQLLVKEKNEKEMLIKEKNKLMQEKQTLFGDNEKLKQQTELLPKTLDQKSEIITQITMDNAKDIKVSIHVLQKVFTAGQIKLMLMSPNANTRIKWSAEDITSAIALRSISPKAY